MNQETKELESIRSEVARELDQLEQAYLQQMNRFDKNGSIHDIRTYEYYRGVAMGVLQAKMKAMESFKNASLQSEKEEIDAREQ